jgi:glycosyltransferase involved in cell wall biosynthesis
MRFSIVTPSYNQVQYITDTIESVLGQTHTDYEYIVVDGASTDGTSGVLDKYRDKVSQIIVEPDDGQTDAINKGLRRASGDIYAYLNSDDCYFEDTLEKVNQIFTNHPEVDVVYGDCVFINAEGQFIRYFSEIWDYSKDRLLNNGNFIMQPSTFWRRTVYEKYGPFDKKLHYGFDWALWCEFAKNNCVFYRAPYVLSANREYGETKTSSGGKERLEELKTINNYYKTALVPTAYYSFSYAEYRDSRNKSTKNLVLTLFYLLLSYRNVISRLLNCNNNVINGVYEHTGYLQKHARISMPRHTDYSTIHISLIAPGCTGQTVKVNNKGRELGSYAFNNGLLDVDIDIKEFSGDIDVIFEFEKEYKRRLTIRDRLRNPCEPKVVAAELKSFMII